MPPEHRPLGLKGSQAPPAFEGLKFVSPSLEAAKKSLPEHRFDGGPRDTKGIGERGIENAEAKRERQRQKAVDAAADRGWVTSKAITADLDAYALPSSPAHVMANERTAPQLGRRPGVGKWQPWKVGSPIDATAPRPASAMPARPQSATLSRGSVGAALSNLLPGVHGMSQEMIERAALKGSLYKPHSTSSGVRPGSSPGLRPSSSAPRLTPARSEASGGDGATVSEPMEPMEPQLSLIEKMRFGPNEGGYKYDGVLRPGSCFFAAIEAAVRDTQQRGLPPLQLRMPPTIIFGLGALHGGESGGDPLWLWSDMSSNAMGSGGGLRAMRRNITSVSDALAFLVGGDIARAHAASISLIEIAASAVAKASMGSAPLSPVRKRATLPTDPQQAAADASTAEGTAVEGGSPPALVDAAQSGAADGGASSHGGASGAGALTAAAAPATAPAPAPAAGSALAKLQKTLDVACCVLKKGNIKNSGLQEVRVLSTHSLADYLNSVMASPPSCDSNVGAIPNATGVSVLQRFIVPPTSRASVSRALYRAGRPFRAFTMQSAHLIPRPFPSGKALDALNGPIVMGEVLTASTAQPNAVAALQPIKGDDWRDISDSMERLMGAILRATGWCFEELVLERPLNLIWAPRLACTCSARRAPAPSPQVLELIRIPREPSAPWFMTQVKAFKAEKDERAQAEAMLGVPPTVRPKFGSLPPPFFARRFPAPAKNDWRPLETYCVGDHCVPDGPAMAREGFVASRKLPYRWIVFDRLDASIHRKVESSMVRLLMASDGL